MAHDSIERQFADDQRVTEFADDTDPLIRDLEPVLRDAQPTLASLRRLVPRRHPGGDDRGYDGGRTAPARGSSIRVSGTTRGL